MSKNFDLIILGGGIVGLTLAACLQNSHLQIAIIDSHTPENLWDDKTYALRVSAINRASENIFQQAEIWEQINSMRVSPFNKIQVSDQTGAGKISFDRKDIAEPNLGYIIENCVMQKTLLEQIKSKENIHYFAPINVQDFWHDDASISLQLEGGEAWQTKLIVGADGATSWLRSRAGFELNEKDYDHHALICNISSEMPHQQTARQWFLGGSVLALLPLMGEHDYSIVWSAIPERTKQLCTMNTAQFTEELAAIANLGKIALTSERKTFPLSMRHAKNYVKPRLALIGDAAHTIHPLAGQGVNLGIADAARLAEVLLQAATAKRDIGLLPTLRKYERWRRGENTAMILAMDAFKYLFASDVKPIIWARNLGLNLTDKSLLLKQFFSRKAIGTCSK